MAGLTAKQERFISEYLIDLNATQAAIRASYSPKNADKIGSQLLGNTRVSARIKEAIAEQSKRTGINADRVIKELAKIALVNADDFINMRDATVKEGADRDNTAVISSIKVKYYDGEVSEREIKLADKIKALELLGKHLGMFTDKLDLNANVAVKIVDDIN